jgi:hypothetical protein
LIIIILKGEGKMEGYNVVGLQPVQTKKSSKGSILKNTAIAAGAGAVLSQVPVPWVIKQVESSNMDKFIKESFKKDIPKIRGNCALTGAVVGGGCYLVYKGIKSFLNKRAEKKQPPQLFYMK